MDSQTLTLHLSVHLLIFALDLPNPVYSVTYNVPAVERKLKQQSEKTYFSFSFFFLVSKSCGRINQKKPWLINSVLDTNKLNTQLSFLPRQELLKQSA